MTNGKIWKIVTRMSPNLECGFFAALLVYLEVVRKKLGVTRGKIEWEFISTASDAVEPEDGVICFNVGGGRFDQHVDPRNQSLCVLCSLDLLRGEYDFLARRPWLRQVYEMVRLNDTKGQRLSYGHLNLREIMTGLTVKYLDNPQLVLDWLTVAFCGIFESLKNGRSIKKVFNSDRLSAGVQLYDAEKLEWFNSLKNEGIETIRKETEEAKRAVERAEELGRTKGAVIPGIGAIALIEVRSDSVKTGPIGRKYGYEVVVQIKSSCHVLIHGGIINKDDEEEGDKRKIRIHMGKVVRALRFCEAKFANKSIAPGQDWEATDVIKFGDGTVIPWFFPAYGSSAYNGTLSSKDMPPTKIRHDKILNLVCKVLPTSNIIVEEGDSRWIESVDENGEWVVLEEFAA